MYVYQKSQLLTWEKKRNAAQRKESNVSRVGVAAGARSDPCTPGSCCGTKARRSEDKSSPVSARAVPRDHSDREETSIKPWRLQREPNSEIRSARISPPSHELKRWRIKPTGLPGQKQTLAIRFSKEINSVRTSARGCLGVKLNISYLAQMFFMRWRIDLFWQMCK